MGIAIKKLFAELLFLMLQMLDGIMSFFRILCGIENVNSNGDTTNLLDLFLQSNAIVQAFMSVFVISIFVLALSIIVAVVRTIIKSGKDKRTHGQTVALGIGSIVTTAIMSVLMLTGVFVSNEVLKYVDDATVSNSNLTMSQQIFELCVNKEYRTEYTKEPIKDEDGNYVFDEETGEQLFEWKLNIKEGESAWQNGATVEQITFGYTTVDEVFGVKGTNIVGFEKPNSDYTIQPMVALDDFNLFLAYFVVIILLVCIVMSMLGLVKRLYDLVILFLMLPLISATIPADDGTRFKQWRETVVSKVVLGYGAVISINVFMLILPIIMNITVSDNSFTNGAFTAFLMLGGALCINGGQLIIARIFGTSAEESRDMANSARALLAGTSAGTAMVLGRRMADGKRVGGLVGLGKGSLGFTAGATNLAGSVMGGRAYQKGARFVTDKAKGLGNFLRGRLPSQQELYRQNGQAQQESGVFSNGVLGVGASAYRRHKEWKQAKTNISQLEQAMSKFTKLKKGKK